MEELHAGRIRFSPSILKRLGEELNPNVDQGLIELVKNSYDANSRKCHIWLGTQEDSSSIIIEDDGDGMTADDINSSWLILGESSKAGQRTTGRLGRIPAGNKGLGRLAALRLGRRARMVSRPGDGFQYEVILDWDRFDRARTVDEVEVLTSKTPAADAPRGTRIELSQLRDTYGRAQVRSLARALVLLADPFNEADDSFSPILHSREYSDLAEQVSRRYFDDAEYHLRASLNSGRARAEVYDWKGNLIWSANTDDLGIYEAPDADLDLWVFILNKKSFIGRSASLAAVRNWLSSFGGVHVYVNGLRVAPYGNPGSDWLDMNLRRAQSPENRPSTNTSIGRIRINDLTGVLLQKTDRSGFVESTSFYELRRFATDCLEWMARRRQAAAEKRRQSERTSIRKKAEAERSVVEESIRKIDDPTIQRAVEAAFVGYAEANQRLEASLRKDLQLYRTLSTAGITVATFSHDIMGGPIKIMDLMLSSLKSFVSQNCRSISEDFGSRIDRIQVAVEDMRALSEVSLKLVKEKKRRVGRVLVAEAVNGAIENIEPFLKKRNIEIVRSFEGAAECYIRGTEAAIESIVTNLINNSVSALAESVDRERKIFLGLCVDERGLWFEIQDTGPGIVGIDKNDIWLPGNTTRKGGTGLGLTIVKDNVMDLGGEIAVEPVGKMGGAVFKIRLPLDGDFS